MALWKASISFLITHGGLRKIWQKKIILCNLTKLMLFDVCWSQPCEDIFCFQTDSYSHGARTPTVSWVWGRGSPVPRPPDPSSLWWGSPCLRSVLEETTALPCPSQGPCLAGAKTALASWALETIQVCTGEAEDCCLTVKQHHLYCIMVHLIHL